jgi:LuxR family maltose regulon positive regulatory protein
MIFTLKSWGWWFEFRPLGVIATREDPDIPLVRLSAWGRLTELRATDLRFTSSEAGEFLNQVMG